MEYVVVSDRESPGSWRVEMIDHTSEGECYVAIFSGPYSQQRAEEYAAFKRNQTVSVFRRLID